MMRSPSKSGRVVVHGLRAAFTIIELLTVMAIILILAGLVLAIAGNAQYKAALSRATGEVKALETASNNYQIDNGTYPRVTMAGNATFNTDTLDPRQNTDPASTGNPTYGNSSTVLYRLLSGNYYLDSSPSGSGTPPQTVLWVSGSAVPKPTVYFPFKDSQLRNNNNITVGYISPGDVTAIQDPFGFSYGYSTAYQAAIDSSPTTTPTVGYNPTYDLWSTAGYSKTSGKAYPTANFSTTNIPTLWVKNW